MAERVMLARGRRRSGPWRCRREEVEAGAGGGTSQVEAKKGVGQGDGEAGENALVDLGLAGPDEAAELLGAVAHLIARAPLTGGDERGEVVTGDKAGQAVGRQGSGLGGEEVPGDEDEECYGGTVIPARHIHRRPARWLHQVPSPSSSWRPVAGRAECQSGRMM